MNLEKINITNSKVKSPTAKKFYQKFKPVWIISSVAVGLGLSSCVDPAYNAYGGGSNYHSTGYQINSLPSGYRTENISGRTYYYHDGHYYQPSSSGYAVVSAPRTSRYYDDYTRTRRIYSSDRNTSRTTSAYTTRDGQRYTSTEIVRRLPSGYREINHRGNTYYRSGDRYYQQQQDGYVIVQSPY